MKLLILTCSTGGGHNSAARAISERFEKAGHSCDTVNALDFLSRTASGIISHGHSLTYRYAPKLYGAGYRLTEKLPSGFMYEQNSKGAEELGAFLDKAGYDAVICVHIFAGMMMTELRASGSYDIPTAFVATDYTCSPGAADIDADAYFIPHEKLRGEFSGQGMPEDRIIASGIPVKSDFLLPSDKKAAREKLAFPQDGRVVLVCCGSMGCGPIRSMALRLLEDIGENDRLVIVCGSNKQLYRDLEFLTASESRVVLCGFTDKMQEYMAACDLIITKAGGLSTTEAAAKRLPIIYIDAVPGVETRNIEFMTANGYAVQAGSASQIAALVAACLGGALDPMAMVRNRERDFPFNAADTILETMERLERESRARRLLAESSSGSESPDAPLGKRPRLDKEMMLIINPVAGRRVMAKSLSEVISVFMDAGYFVTVFPTGGRGDAAEFAEKYGREYDLICCSGGDGTLKETVSGLVRAGLDRPIGYLPSGSTNDFADFNGIPTDVLAAAHAIVGGKPKRFDVGLLDGECFINAAEFGAFTWLPYTTPQRLKNALGFYAYILDGIKDLTKLQCEHLKLTIDGETLEGEYIFGIVASSSCIVGSALELFGEPVFSDDGLFEVVLVKKPNSPLELERTVTALRNQQLDSRLIIFRRTSSIKMSCRRDLDWAIDGEKTTAAPEHSVEMLKQRMQIIV